MNEEEMRSKTIEKLEINNLNFLIHKNEFMIENKFFFLWFWFWFWWWWLDELFSYSDSDSEEDIKLWLFLLKEEEEEDVWFESDFVDLMRWNGNSSIVVKIYLLFCWLIVGEETNKFWYEKISYLISHPLPYLIKLSRQPSHQKQNNIKKKPKWQSTN